MSTAFKQELYFCSYPYCGVNPESYFKQQIEKQMEHRKEMRKGHNLPLLNLAGVHGPTVFESHWSSSCDKQNVKTFPVLIVHSKKRFQIEDTNDFVPLKTN